jgi:hypothetical protein
LGEAKANRLAASAAAKPLSLSFSRVMKAPSFSEMRRQAR